MTHSSKQRHISGSKKKSVGIPKSFDLNVVQSKNTYLNLTDTQKLHQTNSGKLVSFSLDYRKFCLKIKPPTTIKVSTDINTAGYIWHQKTFWESPHICHKALLLYSRSLSPSIWSPSLAPQWLPPKEGDLGEQTKRNSATVSWMELTGDMASWTEGNPKLLTDLWFHSQRWKWETSKIIPQTGKKLVILKHLRCN